MTRTALVLVALSLSCAAQKPQAKKEVLYSSAGQPKPKGVMRCRMEQETGSNRMERICAYDEPEGGKDTTVDDAMIKMQQRAAQHVMPNAGQ